MYYVYVLYDGVKNKFYTGLTNNLDRRRNEHNLGNTQTTSRMQEKSLVYYEASLLKTDAVKREKQLKTGFGRGYLRNRIKNYLNNSDNKPR